MKDIEKAKLEEIADALIATLGNMPAKQADVQVAQQAIKIYEMLGLTVKLIPDIKEGPSVRLCL